MALRPRFPHRLWEDPWEGMPQPSRLFDQYFGNILPDDFCRAAHRYFPRFLCPHQNHQMQLFPTGLSEVVNSDQEFRVTMDVQHFKPEEINIKTKDNRIIVNARHEEREDEHGFISREFTRQYVLPKYVDPESVTSSLSSDGVLTLKAPKMSLEAPKERVIPITREKDEEEKEK